MIFSALFFFPIWTERHTLPAFRDRVIQWVIRPLRLRWLNEQNYDNWWDDGKGKSGTHRLFVAFIADATDNDALAAAATFVVGAVLQVQGRSWRIRLINVVWQW